jgi:D-sedoheptulose 7-phosphate isomerase
VRERRSLPALALTTDSSALTAIGNDYGFDQVFARQLEGLGQKGDILIAISTSGNSPNVLKAAEKARSIGCAVISLTGASGGKLAGLSDLCFKVPSSETARIQEMHLLIEHLLCDLADKALAG